VQKSERFQREQASLLERLFMLTCHRIAGNAQAALSDVARRYSHVASLSPKNRVGKTEVSGGFSCGHANSEPFCSTGHTSLDEGDNSMHIARDTAKSLLQAHLFT
jgi:hypothetical protein